MLGEGLNIGDTVIAQIPDENWSWGYRPCPQGTELEIKGWGSIDYGRTSSYGREPGIYENRAWATCSYDDPEKGYQEFSISTCFLLPKDEGKYNERIAEIRAANNGIVSMYTKLCDLPDTPVWEGDKIKLKGDHPRNDGEVYILCGIDYLSLGRFCNDNVTLYPAYKFTDEGGGWNMSARGDHIELVERGNVWKYYHDEPLSFSDLKEEAEFYRLIGRTEEVRNPANNLYRWTITEAYQALKDGLGHAFTVSPNIISGNMHTSVIRFKDEELGKRVAEYTLANIPEEHVPGMQERENERKAREEEAKAQGLSAHFV